MDRLATGEPRWSLFFDENGGPTEGNHSTVGAEMVSERVTDLFVFSHGWNNSMTAAGDLYNTMFPMLRAAANTRMPDTVPGFVGVYWPSLWFPDSPASVAGIGDDVQASSSAMVDESAGTNALSGAEIADKLRRGFAGSTQATIVELGRLIDDGLAAAASGASEDEQRERLAAFQDLLADLVPTVSSEESGDAPVLFTDDPVYTYRGVAQAFGTVPPGSATQDLGSVFRAAFTGAKDVLRIFSYRTMKARAGTVGAAGLGPILASWREASPALRVHLMGHSFGARLVSFALTGVGDASASPVASLLLIQGAFSHWGFSRAQDNPFGQAGPLHAVANRVHGPLAATFSRHDRAVCFWYPRASFLSGDSLLADSADRWGAMGADGFQAVAPAVDLVLAGDGSLDGKVVAGSFHRVDANGVIQDETQSAFSGAHSDICHPSVAELAVTVANVTRG
jgi:hypothetical protein